MFKTVVAELSRVTEGTGMMLIRSLAPGLLPGGRGGREGMIVSLRSFLACAGSGCPDMAIAKLHLGIRDLITCGDDTYLCWRQRP